MPEHPLFSDEYIDKLKRAAERHFTSRIKLLFRRQAISIQASKDIYELPEDVSDLIAVKYKGNFLTPGNLLSSRDRSVLAVINRGITGTPNYYFIKEYNYNSIRLWPCPGEDIVADQNVLDYSTGISSQCIIYYYRLSDEENELPPFLRRRLIKYYVMKFAYQKEGESQDIKASQYFEQKLEWAISQLENFVIDCSGARYYAIAPVRAKYTVPRPVLPPNFPAR